MPAPLPAQPRSCRGPAAWWCISRADNIHVCAVARVNLLLRHSSPIGSLLWVDSAGAGAGSVALTLSRWDESLCYGQRDSPYCTAKLMSYKHGTAPVKISRIFYLLLVS